jgi:UDPglucose--hexose-1-phosphate uridylyltransferase
VSQLRLNPLNGRWVTIVAERAHRPHDFAPRNLQVEADPQQVCPFCPGAEELTPPALETQYRDGAWSVRVVPNRYPAFEGHDSMAVHNLGPVHVQADASGIHEVIVLSPKHQTSWKDLDDEGAAQVMSALRKRMAGQSLQPNIRYTQAIVNQGREAGASLSHPHGQLLGMPFVPGEIVDEERAFTRFEGGCILCVTAEAELADGGRVVVANEHVTVVCPFWSGTPYEMLVIPTRHEGHLYDSPTPDLAAVARAIRDALAMLADRLGDIAYNLVFHTAPHQHHDEFHWHVHLWPKLVTVAGFERGTGVMINITPPEDAAEELRSVARINAG